MSFSSIPKFDVFLSFSAEDTTKNFVQDLYSSLSKKGVATYHKYDKPEERDSCLGSDLSKCIIESKLVVVVISGSYPSSVFCLNQLETIINCHDQGRSVLPIFYGVDPSNVRKQSGEVEEPFRKLGEEYPAEKVQTWRTALTKLTKISSLDSRYWNMEAKAIELITKEILLIISDKPKATKSGGLVALDRHMQALYKLLDLQSKEEVRLIGICGQGGVGKTTLARYAYEELSTNFHAHMFVDNAENIYHQDHCTSNETQKSLNLGYDDIKSTVEHRKGLLVIDCVDNVKQLKDIADIVGSCGRGSRVILVTQEKSLLVEFGVKHVYQVNSLRYHEALQLFSQSAFNQRNPPASFESLSFRAVQVAHFLPLTLKILGSSLQGKNNFYWESKLQKLEGAHEKAITKALIPPSPSMSPAVPTSSPYPAISQLSSQASSPRVSGVFRTSRSVSTTAPNRLSSQQRSPSSPTSSHTPSRLFSKPSSRFSRQAYSMLSSQPPSPMSPSSPTSSPYPAISQLSSQASSPRVSGVFRTSRSVSTTRSNRLSTQPSSLSSASTYRVNSSPKGPTNPWEGAPHG